MSMARPSFLLAACSIGAGVALAQNLCASGFGTGDAVELKGNWYCSEVNAITYSNFPDHGSYDKITAMDAVTGVCESVEYTYSGSLSPVNEELSLHIRGPIALKQVAYYAEEAQATEDNQKRHLLGHQHTNPLQNHQRYDLLTHNKFHKREKAIDFLPEEVALNARSIGDVVSATIDGKLVTWINEYSPTSTGFTPRQPAVSSATHQLEPVAEEKVAVPASTASSDWNRNAYYSAAESTSEGLTFLNHFGGQNGVPGTTAGGSAFGASLSYASQDGSAGPASPQTLANQMLKDNIEVVIMTDQSCDDGKCGYVRPGGVAYHGFSGSQKAFILEFTMPLTGSTTYNGDMPSVWLNNAQIPLTSQYGTNPNCSCWESGCGEFDVFEVLDQGDLKCKSTLHMNPAGGPSDYFARPTKDSVLVAILFAGDIGKVMVKVLDPISEIPETLSATTRQQWLNASSTVYKVAS